MNKKILKTFLLVLVFIYCCILSSCVNKKIETITVSVYLDGECIEDITIMKGSKLDFDLGEDYLFLGWYDETLENRIDGIILDSDITVYAKAIEKGKKYQIKYHLTDDAHFSNYNYPRNYEVGVTTKLINPVRELNYEFNGWYYNNERIEEIPDNIYGVIDLYDSWIDNNIYYNVNYHDDGAQSYSFERVNKVIEGATYDLPYPIKEGYYFKGWYRDSNFTTRIYNLDGSDRNDVDIYAKFEKKSKNNTYVSFVGDSISTYHGLIPEDAGAYYPTFVNFPKEKTYFLQVCNGMGFNFLKNNSYSGSRLSTNVVQDGVTLPCALSDYRIDGLTDGINDPDILIIHLGTNEYSQGITAQAFEKAMEQYVNKVRRKYDDVEIYFCTHPCNRYPEHCNKPREEFNEVIMKNASRLGYNVFDLRECWSEEEAKICCFANAHPSELGFERMATLMINELKKTHNYE